MSGSNLAQSSANERTKFCKHCAETIRFDAVVCNKCGLQVEDLKSSQPNIIVNYSNVNTNSNINGGYIRNQKSKWVSLVLCFFFGVLGIHKFYEGKIGLGILYIFTGGLFGIGVFIDFIVLLFKPNPYYL